MGSATGRQDGARPASRRIIVQSHKNGRAADLVIGPLHVTLTWPEVERLKDQLATLQRP